MIKICFITQFYPLEKVVLATLIFQWSLFIDQQSTVFLSKDFNGKTNDLVLKVAHSKPELELFWYVDNVYIGSTKEIHDMAILPNPGEYTLTVVDELGNELKHKITVAD